MTIHTMISFDAISLDLVSRTKDGVLFELAELLKFDHRISNLALFIEDIKKRESLGSTGIGYGIAIPHAKSSHVLEPCIAFGISIEGIDFESMDEEVAHLFFMIAMPEDGANLHLKALAMLSRHLMHEAFRDKLMKVETKEAFLNLIKQMDQEG